MEMGISQNGFGCTGATSHAPINRSSRVRGTHRRARARLDMPAEPNQAATTRCHPLKAQGDQSGIFQLRGAQDLSQLADHGLTIPISVCGRCYEASIQSDNSRVRHHAGLLQQRF